MVKGISTDSSIVWIASGTPCNAGACTRKTLADPTYRQEMSDLTMSQLFDREPDQWGLRGDPHLWKAMQEYFVDTLIPADSDTLRDCIADAFAKLTGQPLTTREDFHLERFAHGGMSSGHISPPFWRGPGIDKLIDNWRALQR